MLGYRDLNNRLAKLRYWRDSAGPEIDYVIEVERKYIPIEVKWSNAPTLQDAKHLIKFLQEYSNATEAYIICRTPTEYVLGANKNIKVISWQQLHTIFTR